MYVLRWGPVLYSLSPRRAEPTGSGARSIATRPGRGPEVVRVEGRVLVFAERPSILSAIKDLLRGQNPDINPRGARGYKPIADRFEALLGKLFTLRGMEGSLQWLSTIFTPLIVAGSAAGKVGGIPSSKTPR